MSEERAPLELAMLAAWLNVRPDQLPPELRAPSCAYTMAAWKRVGEAALEAQAAEIEELKSWKAAEDAHHHAMRAEIKRLREALEPFVLCYEHTAIFLRSKEKMHPDGQDLYRKDVERARAALGEPTGE